MAETLDEFPDIHKGKRNTHPWELWGDGRVWRLTKGVDFKSTITALRMAAKRHADRLNMSVRTAAEGKDKLIIQFYREQQ